MLNQFREVQYFFFSQAFADGFRATFAILLPALFGLYFDFFEIGLTISLGAMCVSITDAPGPFIQKRNGLIICTLFVFIASVITGFARQNDYILAVNIAIICFFFSMFNVYGNRAGGVGSAAILIMIITLDNPGYVRVLDTSLLLLYGGTFYTVFSLLLYKLRPYRIVQRSLGDCIREIAKYLSIRADFYFTNTELLDDYNKMVLQQIHVHEKQDALRELLFKTRQIVQESTVPGRKLVVTFIESVDLFENITATYYDYATIRQQFADTGALEKIGQLLKKMSFELDNMGYAIQGNMGFQKGFDYDQEIIKLKAAIDAVSSTEKPSHILKRILVNIRQVLTSFNNLAYYFEDKEPKKIKGDHSQFISHQSLSPKEMWDNITFRSSIFRHALRVSIACVFGFFIAKTLAYGEHSYWILLTIAFILKPAYSLTKERNVQRLIGTLIGGGIAAIVLLFIPNATTQFIIMVILMIGTYSFMRINYFFMVICVTPYVVIVFKFLGVGFVNLAGERILDTAVGCIIAFTASYILFPQWEKEQINQHLKNMIAANKDYLQKILDAILGNQIPVTDYRLCRKEVYVASANLGAAFQRMISEPKNTHTNDEHVHQFVVLNHILFSNVASVATTFFAPKNGPYPYPLQVPVRKALQKLNDAYAQLNATPPPEFKSTGISEVNKEITHEEKIVLEQLLFIEKISSDINKVTSRIIDKPLNA